MLKFKASNRKDDPGRCSWACCCFVFLIIFVILGLILSAVGLFLVVRYRSIFNGILSKKMPLSPTSSTLESFKKPPADIYMSFRFFNVTNPQDVIKGAKPVLSEIGPYVYKNRREKENIKFSDDETNVSYEERRFYEFDAEKSTGSESDTFVSLDLVGYSVLKTAFDGGQIGLVAKTVVKAKRVNPFREHVVKDFLFGAPDNLLEKVLPLKFPDENTRPPAVFGILVDKATGKSKDGLVDSNYTLNTGKKDFKRYQMVEEYNGITRYNNVWPVENMKDPITGEAIDANIIRGTLGTGWTPGINEKSVLPAFASDLCLAIDFVYNSSSKTGQIDTMRFMIDVANWAKFGGQLNREMCAPEDRNDPVKCTGEGVVNVTSCRGAALMMSLPHFLHADPFYQNLTEGLNPDEKKHSTYLDIDPLTGAALNVAKRLQMNVRLLAFNYRNYTNLPPFTMLPIMWIEEAGGVTPKGLEGLKEKVHKQFNMLKTLGYGLLIAGIALIPITVLVYLIFKMISRIKGKQSQQDDVVRMDEKPQQKQGQKRQDDGGQVIEEKRPLATQRNKEEF